MHVCQGQTDRLTDRLTDKHRQMDGRMDRWTDGWMDRQMDRYRQTNRQTGILAVKTYHSTVIYLRASGQNMIKLYAEDSSKFTGLSNQVHFFHQLNVTITSDNIILNCAPPD